MKKMKRRPPGIYRDGKYYKAQRFFCFIGIVATRQNTIRQASARLNAMQEVQKRVLSRLNEKIMAEKSSTLADFVTYVKAAVAEVRAALSELNPLILFF